MKKICLSVLCITAMILGACGGGGGSTGASVPSGVSSSSSTSSVRSSSSSSSSSSLSLGSSSSSASSAAGVLSLFAGDVTASGSADGVGVDARFNGPQGLAVDTAGNLYVADFSNSTIRKISVDGVVSTVAGAAGVTGTTDGNATDARFGLPAGIAIDPVGNIFVSDEGFYTIREISIGGMVTTFAGSPGGAGVLDGLGSAARFRDPDTMTAGASGSIYVTDSSAYVIRKISPSGLVTTLAGSSVTGSADGNGSNASFGSPSGVVADSMENLYVADSTNETIRKISSTGDVTTIAGAVGQLGSVDGVGINAHFALPRFMGIDGSGNLYVGDTYNCTIRKISPTGMVTTIVGTASVCGFSPGPLPGTIGSISGIVVYGNTLYATLGNAVIKVTPLQ